MLERHSNVYSTTEVSPTLNHGCKVQEQVSVAITLLPRVQEIIRYASYAEEASSGRLRADSHSTSRFRSVAERHRSVKIFSCVI